MRLMGLERGSSRSLHRTVTCPAVISRQLIPLFSVCTSTFVHSSILMVAVGFSVGLRTMSPPPPSFLFLTYSRQVIFEQGPGILYPPRTDYLNPAARRGMGCQEHHILLKSHAQNLVVLHNIVSPLL